MKKQISLLPLIIFLLVLSSFFYLLIIERNPTEIPSNLLNKNVPSFKADILSESKKFVSINEFGKQITLVNFFATWCKPCLDEHKFIKLFSNEKKLRVIGINYKDRPNKTIAWLKKLGNPYSEVLLDKSGNIGIDWGVYGIPETFVINSEGIIKYRHVGPITKKDFKKINSLISKLK